MKTTFAFLIAFAALGAAAQEEQQPDVKVDYSKPALQRFVSSIPVEPKRDRNMHFYVGGVEFRALGTRYRFNYLPLMTPLSGSRLGVTQEWPDPFSLTGTAIATPRRAWRTQRQVDAEMKRIEKSERAKIKVKVNVNANSQ